MKTTAQTLEWAYELEPKVAGQVAHYVDILKSRIVALEAALERIRRLHPAEKDPADTLFEAVTIAHAALIGKK